MQKAEKKVAVTAEIPKTAPENRQTDVKGRKKVAVTAEIPKTAPENRQTDAKGWKKSSCYH